MMWFVRFQRPRPGMVEQPEHLRLPAFTLFPALSSVVVAIPLFACWQWHRSMVTSKNV